ncbi:PTS system mannose/fructose/sorbose family transporter subunit IID [Phocoenobacter skyensis]|uniref:PTS system mannose/fructose/sorbose family transporter subunit IID n=1 Tax=Phocoenobacter skyensis TaxID=97481 RepID=A0A1H7WNG8_9PAST|nr:PTS system mannose/fructose/sorbose family transporter subunit IID [Pasteurella skyensis]MDP8078961.1 PTS system mannose/fructose/sorbose family transporter subunit IID [Pasteurella skyensis]MDP8084911.1 PTS system mannose/fructose/sorbose family transporter subunit IID [Pasteurella skyensis]MDP8162867.1 PTS system mannose/fructose/sorbose family transporter subunit IID [Pasteurella skyensis]MDP8172546.1 PTS system mannose/fructose/sorbose family transporter subunit IID [Pasteurella skyensis
MTEMNKTVDPDVYEDQTKQKVITNKDISKMAWRSLFLQASFNYERMQANGWLYTILPSLRKIHKNEEDLKKSMGMHLEFFNTHPFLVTFISGLVLAMEESKERVSTIRAIKISTMGPGGGIGDAVFWLTLLSICGGVGASFSLNGSWLGPIFFLVAFNLVHFGLRFGLASYGYKMGVSAIANLKEQTKRLGHAASIVGLTVIGAMTASYVRLEAGLQMIRHVPGVEKPYIYTLQGDLIDPIMPKLLPLLWTLMILWRIKKGDSALRLVMFTVIFGLVCTLIPVLVKMMFGVDIIDPAVLATRMS